ncbi:hypothetical protein SBRY_50457 [Actinacidiphila bryophytorum]|uniref:Uncharacterized protein n=1 Tax=Actinacidiphila bryophytorum TaxID=1436133 RepID=A0A9W4MJC6_9ACTN|nr:hypothetical protein SBRY_50457 [Actinacidiphila bryophytorum]
MRGRRTGGRSSRPVPGPPPPDPRLADLPDPRHHPRRLRPRPPLAPGITPTPDNASLRR